ncbi:hypothetical protein [Streptomyces sp. NPDC001275]
MVMDADRHPGAARPLHRYRRQCAQYGRELIGLYNALENYTKLSRAS